MILSNPREARAPAGRAGRARAFDELRRYHTRSLRLNWGSENVHFGKSKNRKKSKSIGVQKRFPLFGENVYRAMFKKSLENEK